MDTIKNVREIAEQAKKAAQKLACLDTITKNNALLNMATALQNNKQKILDANDIDVKNAKEKGTSESMIDRLKLTNERIDAMAEDLRYVATLKDPIGDVLGGSIRPNGLSIRKVRVPIGVIGMIYESRPNVTIDAASLCLKSGNAVILRGGSDAINSNIVLTDIIKQAAKDAGIPDGSIELIRDTNRETVVELMQLNGLVDLIIPRGGAGLIQTVVKNATVPTIETGVGNCHIYVDESADFEMAKSLVINSKTNRPSVCNAAEKLLVHRSLKDTLFVELIAALKSHTVEILGDNETVSLIDGASLATEEDWYTEFIALKMAVKLVDNIDEAIAHIQKYTSHHTELIITNDFSNAEQFTKEVDASSVNVNASTRFTDGGMFGLGSEIGISTQKLHARGPMGLEEMTSMKFIVVGNGQIR